LVDDNGWSGDFSLNGRPASDGSGRRHMLDECWTSPTINT
jgi:hypothetical protein